MIKRRFLIFFVILLFAFTSCSSNVGEEQNNSDISDPEVNTGVGDVDKVIADTSLENLKISEAVIDTESGYFIQLDSDVLKQGETSVSFTWGRKTGDASIRDNFMIEVYIDGIWYELTPIKDMIFSTASLSGGGDEGLSVRDTVDFSEYYGELPVGSYRILKPSIKNYWCTAEFTVTE